MAVKVLVETSISALVVEILSGLQWPFLAPDSGDRALLA